MKEWLVDVPVQISIWIRPENQRRQFEIIKEARPRVLILTSDGGRNEEEWEAIQKNRALYDEGIDWDCEIHRLYLDKNYGLYTVGQKTMDLVWSKVDRCIFLEDDILPAIDYFRFCEDLLEYYKDDTRVSMICGMNHMETWKSEDVDYFFSFRGSIWGCAIWKRTYELNWNLDYQKNPYLMETLFRHTKGMKDYQKQVMDYVETGAHEGHRPGAEFFFKNSFFAQNQLSIIPSKNLISNIGFGDGSAHSDTLERLPRAVRRLFNMRTYSIDHPIRHLSFVIPDEEFERKHRWVTGYGHPLLIRARKLERIFLILKSGDMKYLQKKIQMKLSKEKWKET